MNRTVFSRHDRTFEDNLYVYPVISRRSKGLSLGINLSLRKECNFDCVYCQVDRTEKEVKEKFVDISVLKKELLHLIDISISGDIFEHSRFIDAPTDYKKLVDIALSGDGESTTSKYFIEAAEIVLEIVSLYKKQNIFIKPIVITNGTTLNKPNIQKYLLEFSSMGGGAWIKLDAGTEAEFKKIAETSIPFQTILDNIINFSQLSPVILQTIIYRDIDSYSFSPDQWIDCINDMQKKGASFQYVQLYTLARSTRIKTLSSLSEKELSELAKQIQDRTGIPIQIYP